MSTGARWGLVWLIIATGFCWFKVFQVDNRERLVFWPEIEDGVFIQTDQGEQILVNGGRDRSILRKLGQEMPWGDKRIDLVVLTSVSADYLTGLTAVLKNYQVDNVLWSGIVENSPSFQDWESLIKEKGIREIIASAGTEIKLGSSSFKILAPPKNFYRHQLADAEMGEVVWRFQRGQKKFLFLGKAPAVILASLAERDWPAEIVEINQAQRYLPWAVWSKINPRAVVVSGAGKEIENLFNLPFYQTEKRGKITIYF